MRRSIAGNSYGPHYVPCVVIHVSLFPHSLFDNIPRTVHLLTDVSCPKGISPERRIPRRTLELQGARGSGDKSRELGKPQG